MPNVLLAIGTNTGLWAFVTLADSLNGGANWRWGCESWVLTVENRGGLEELGTALANEMS